jgi:hypothetical protein
MSNATQDSRNSGDSRRRRNRGGQNRNQNNNERRENGGGDRGERGPRHDRGRSQGRNQSSRSEEFRPQAPRPARTYAPVKLSFWQKILKAIGLGPKTPTPPARPERKERKEESTPFPKEARAPKSNTRNARSGEGEARPPREPREARPPREKRPEGERGGSRGGDRPRGGDPKSVESTRVYVGNLSYDVSEQDLQELFKGIGGVRNIEIVYNRSTHRSKGYGFVEMLRMDEAIRAVEVLHDQPFMGRKMTVSGAKSKGQDEREDADERAEDRGPTRVVLASTAPAVAAVAPEPTIETIIETVVQVEEPAALAEVADLEAKYAFDAPTEKATEA